MESTWKKSTGAFELFGFCQLRILAQLKLEGSTVMATAMNLMAMERSTATVMAIKGPMGMAMVTGIEVLNFLDRYVRTEATYDS